MIKLISLLKEIGDLSYPYKKDPISSKEEIIYKFQLEDGTEFEVSIFVRRKGVVEIDFTSDYSWETTRRQKDVFKIFSTIKAILEEVISKRKVHTILYGANNKKEQIYKKLIQQVYPNAEFNINQYGDTVVSLIKENIENNLVKDTKILSQDEFLKKYSAEFKKFGTYEPHGYISTNNNQPYIRLNDKTIEVTPSEYDNWGELKLKQEYDTSKSVLLKYTAEYDDAQVVEGHHRVKYIIDKDINGELGYVLDDESLENFWNTFN